MITHHFGLAAYSFGRHNNMLALPIPSSYKPDVRPTNRLTRILAAVRDHRWLFIGTWAVPVLLAWLAWLAVPAQYTATASVLVHQKAGAVVAGSALPDGPIPNPLATQQDVMQSENVALRALRVLQPQEDAIWRKRWQAATSGKGVYENWLAEQLLKQVAVRNTTDSKVLVLAYKDGNPERAARIANGLVQAYLETAVDLRLQPARQYSTFFDERVRPAMEALEKAQLRLGEFQQRNELHSLDEHADIDERRLAELGSQITSLEARMAETRGKQREAGAGVASQEAVRDPVVIAARIELAKQETRLAALEATLKPADPQLLQQQQAVGQSQAGLAAALNRAAQSLDLGAKVEASQLHMLKVAYEQQRAKVFDQKTVREEGLRLQRNVDNFQRNYEAELARYQATALESQTLQPDLSILKVATPPVRPSTPPLSWFLSGGALLGLVVALAAVYARDRHGARLSNAEHVVDALQQPFLVQLPHRRSLRSGPLPIMSDATPRYATSP